MARREVAHVEHGRAEGRDLSNLTLSEEPIGDPALIQHLDGARVKAAGARAGEHVIGTLLDDRDVHLGQSQLGREHHPRRAAPGDHHSMLVHRFAPPFAWVLPVRRAIMGDCSGPHEAWICAIK